jgi:anaerobic magnesium-protoporphyrin IX monomethyl ester cyclase
LATDPEVIGFSCYSINMSSTARIIDILKNRYRVNIPIVVGGIHPSSVPIEVLERIPGIDYVVIGEGEETIVELLESISWNLAGIEKVRGISYRHNGTIRMNESRPLVSDLSRLPISDFQYAGTAYRNYVIMTSRGCPFNCHYCSSKVMYGRQVRYRPVDDVIREIELLRNKTGIKHVRFGDDTFTLRKDHMLALHAAMKRQSITDMHYSAGSRIDTIDNEKLEIMKDMGVRFVTLGVETGSQEIMQAIDKGICIDDVVPTVKMINDEGINTMTYFIINHPMETVKDMHATVSLIKELLGKCKHNQISVNTGIPYPATPWWDYCSERSLLSGIDFYRYSHRYNTRGVPLINMSAESMDTLLEIKKMTDGIEFRSNLPFLILKMLSLPLNRPKESWRFMTS